MPLMELDEERKKGDETRQIMLFRASFIKYNNQTPKPRRVSSLCPLSPTEAFIPSSYLGSTDTCVHVLIRGFGHLAHAPQPRISGKLKTNKKLTAPGRPRNVGAATATRACKRRINLNGLFRISMATVKESHQELCYCMSDRTVARTSVGSVFITSL